MERTEVLDRMGELKLYGMRGAYDETLTTALILSAPRKAVGEHEAQLPCSPLSQSISSVAPLAFTSLLATMRRSDFCMSFVPSSLPPSGLPLARAHADLPG